MSGMRGNRLYGFAETNERGEFSPPLPKTLGMDSYSVHLPRGKRGRVKPTIVKYEPFTLQLDLTATDDVPAKSKHRTGSNGHRQAAQDGPSRTETPSRTGSSGEGSTLHRTRGGDRIKAGQRRADVYRQGFG